MIFYLQNILREEAVDQEVNAGEPEEDLIPDVNAPAPPAEAEDAPPQNLFDLPINTPDDVFNRDAGFVNKLKQLIKDYKPNASQEILPQFIHLQTSVTKLRREMKKRHTRINNGDIRRQDLYNR